MVDCRTIAKFGDVTKTKDTETAVSDLPDRIRTAIIDLIGLDREESIGARLIDTDDKVANHSAKILGGNTHYLGDLYPLTHPVKYGKDHDTDAVPGLPGENFTGT